ncbi:MAG TPA: glycosyltransferase, partial [Gemmatimonadales bacterium]|nr:glycosyltransferase [Gemmatimonadales bacterium]
MDVRIGLVSDTYAPQVNGVTTVVQRIAALLRAGGHEATVVAPRYPYAERGEPRRDPATDELRIPSVALPVYRDIRLALPHFRDIARFFDAAPPHVVHVHTEGALGLAGRRYALQRELPLVTTFHTNFPQYSRHYGVGLLEPLVWRWLQWFHRPAAVTFTPGEGVRDELVRRGIWSAAVWGRGVDTQFFHPTRGEPRRDPDPDELRIPSVALPVYPDIRLALPHFRDIARFFDAARPDVVHVHTEGALGLAGRRYALQRQLPLVTTFHTNFPQYSRHYGVGLLEPLVWRWLQWFHRPAQLPFTPGEGVRDELVRRGIGRAAVWGRGVDTQFFHPARRDASWR